MPFSSLIGNDRIKRVLQRAVSEDRVRQSLLMAGPRGVGKYQFAIALAQALNCEALKDGDACGICNPCRRIQRKEHGDVRTLLRESQDPSVKKEPRSRFIKIEQVRDMTQHAQFRPYEGRRRVFIIDEAEWLQQQAANALLKTLEEPPDTTLMILITSKPYSLLETIRSRCLMLSFAPLKVDEIEEYLRADKKLPEDDLRLRARLARGSLGHALEIDLTQYRDKRDRMLETIEAMIRSDVPGIVKQSEYLGKKIDKDEFEDHLDMLLILLSDIFHLKLETTDHSITNTDVAERLERICAGTTIEEVTQLADRVEELIRALPRNLNRQIAMDAILIA